MTDIIERDAVIVDLGEFDASTEAIVRSEIEAQILAARSYPRSMTRFKQVAWELATLDQATADSCYYSLPRREKGKKGKEGKVKYLEGPTVRFAEIIKQAWGNIRSDGRIVDIGSRFVKAQGLAWDMETNNGSRIEVLRRITNRDGKRYSDDMIAVTCNAAISIAVRNAIFDTIPWALARPIYDEAVKVATGGDRSMDDRRREILEAWKEHGVKPDVVLRIIDREGTDDITVRDLRALRGILNAVVSGETTVDRLLRDEITDDRARDFSASLHRPDRDLLRSRIDDARGRGLLDDIDRFEAVLTDGTPEQIRAAVATIDERIEAHDQEGE